MSKPHQALLIISLLALSWLLMQAAHEFGHVSAAWLTGGTVTSVVLNPLAISRTDVEPNPKPLIVAWAGPILGSLIPLAVWALAAAAKLSARYLLRFFCGFCLLANGLYLGLGSLGGIGDAGDILRHGSPQWTLWIFGLATAPSGLALWNGLGPALGLGANPTTIPAKLGYSVAGMLLFVLIAELAFFPAS